MARIGARWGAAPAMRWAVVPAVLCAGLLTASCTAVARTGSPPSPRVSGSPAVPVSAARARYLKIAKAGNRRLEKDFDALEDEDRNRLAAARADLRDAEATEHLFDRRLLAIKLPSQAEAVAHILYRVNQSRARLTRQAARSTSLHQLHAYQRRLEDANKPVEDAVKVIRGILGLPPPDTS